MKRWTEQIEIQGQECDIWIPKGKGRGRTTEVSPTFTDSPGDLVVVLQAPTAAFQTALTPTPERTDKQTRRSRWTHRRRWIDFTDVWVERDRFFSFFFKFHRASKVLIGFRFSSDTAAAATVHLIITGPKNTQVNLSLVTAGTRLHRPPRELAD